MDTTFPSSYECRELTSAPGCRTLPCYYYPGASKEGGRDGIIAEVRPDAGQPWLGSFAFGRVTPKGVSGMFATPDPQALCVVARGAGYWVRVSDPEVWEPIAADPITDVRPVAAQGILVFADYTRLVAYGEAGLRWRTKRLTWDDLKITEVQDEFITGEGWDAPANSSVSFRVSLATGEHEGGIPDV
jgi:hypothetical protein